MTAMRDARLQQALAHAPDAQARPGMHTRAAIRAHAVAAVTPGWRRGWLGLRKALGLAQEGRGGHGQHMPWNAALATVLLASLVTLMWRGEDTPDARLRQADPPIAQQPANLPGPAPSEKAAPVVVPPPSPSPAPAAPAAAPAQKAARHAVGAPPPRMEAAPAVEPMAPAASAVPPPPAESTRAEARGQAGALSDAAAPAAPATRADRADRAAKAVPALRARELLAWTDAVLLGSDGRTVPVARDQAGMLAALVDRVLASPTAEAATLGDVDQRIELRQGGQRVGLLELAGSHARWTAGAAPTVVLRPDAAALQALRDEAVRLAAGR